MRRLLGRSPLSSRIHLGRSPLSSRIHLAHAREHARIITIGDSGGGGGGRWTPERRPFQIWTGLSERRQRCTEDDTFRAEDEQVRRTHLMREAISLMREALNSIG